MVDTRVRAIIKGVEATRSMSLWTRLRRPRGKSRLRGTRRSLDDRRRRRRAKESGSGKATFGGLTIDETAGALQVHEKR